MTIDLPAVHPRLAVMALLIKLGRRRGCALLDPARFPRDSIGERIGGLLWAGRRPHPTARLFLPPYPIGPLGQSTLKLLRLALAAERALDQLCK